MTDAGNTALKAHVQEHNGNGVHGRSFGNEPVQGVIDRVPYVDGH